MIQFNHNNKQGHNHVLNIGGGGGPNAAQKWDQ